MAKLTKGQTIEYLKRIGESMTLDAQAQAIIDYTVDTYNENQRLVSKAEVQEVVNTVEEVTGKSLGQLIAETEGEAPIVEVKVEEKKPLPSKKTEDSIKPATPVIKKKEEPKAEEVTEEKVAPKKESKVVKPHNDYLAKFPETIESKSLKGTLKVRRDLVTIEDVVRAFNNDEDIVIATYWTKKLLKQYADSYDPMGINPNRPKSFENDLDLIELTFANNLVATGCSLYSSIPQIFKPEYFEVDEDGMRYANGCEFEIYEIIEE